MSILSKLLGVDSVCDGEDGTEEDSRVVLSCGRISRRKQNVLNVSSYQLVEG